jgi:Dolichyl-phosphate-mannose-protein mannosyltransferase
MASATLSKPRQDSTPLQRLRAVGSSTWAKIAFVVLCAVALFGYFAFPTYPTYDSFYALLWGRDLLHLHLPDFKVYRGPTEHPLAIAFGMFCSLFGQGGARLMVLGSIASFVALVAGVYRVARLCFGPVVGMFAALLMLSRFFDENLAAQGYLDISYIALIVWAVALEVEKPRRGVPVFLMLAAAGLLRPDAWVLSGAYWLWCVWPARSARAANARSHDELSPAGSTIDKRAPIDNRRRLGYLALAAIAPLVWVCADAVVTGNPFYSLSSTAGLAQELGRTQGLSSVVASVWTYSVRIDKLPVVLGGLIGIPIAVWLIPRRVIVPLAVLVLLVLVFVAEGAVGASVIDRYLMGAGAMLIVFCAVAIGGWSMLERGSKLRRVWMAGAAALVLYGAFAAATTLSLSSLRTTLAYHEDFHKGLAVALANPEVKAELKRCPLISLPNNKLIPDARWILDSVGQHDIVARSEARADADRGSHTLERRISRGSVAVYPLGSAVFFEAIVDVGDDPRDQIPLAGFKRIFTSRYYAVYGNC